MEMNIKGDVIKGFCFVLNKAPDTTTELFALIGYMERVKQILIQEIVESSENISVKILKDKKD